MIDILLAAGADINGKNRHQTPLMTALVFSYEQHVLKLLKYGADCHSCYRKDTC